MTNSTRELAARMREEADVYHVESLHLGATAIDTLLDVIQSGGAVTPRPTPPAPVSEGLRQLRAWHAARRDKEREDSLAQLHDRAVKALNVYFGPEEQL